MNAEFSCYKVDRRAYVRVSPTVTSLAEPRQELLHAFHGLPASSLPSSLLDLVVLEVTERLNHEARARTERAGVGWKL